jgi:hypothetical protein
MFQVLATALSLVFDHLIFLKNMNIYVGNLNWNMSSEDLQNLFTPFGEVTSAKIVTDKFNNDRSKGFGFVLRWLKPIKRNKGDTNDNKFFSDQKPRIPNPGKHLHRAQRPSEKWRYFNWDRGNMIPTFERGVSHLNRLAWSCIRGHIARIAFI